MEAQTPVLVIEHRIHVDLPTDVITALSGGDKQAQTARATRADEAVATALAAQRQAESVVQELRAALRDAEATIRSHEASLDAQASLIERLRPVTPDPNTPAAPAPILSPQPVISPEPLLPAVKTERPAEMPERSRPAVSTPAPRGMTPREVAAKLGSAQVRTVNKGTRRTDERRKVLSAEWPRGTQMQELDSLLNELPGAPIDRDNIATWAWELGLRRPAGFTPTRSPRPARATFSMIGDG